MKKSLKKKLSVLLAVIMMFSAFTGINIVQHQQVAAASTDITNAVITPWVVYSAGQIDRSHDGWLVRYYNSFTTSAGETKTNWDDNFPNMQYVDGGEETWQTTKTATGFTANIANTGWDATYEAGIKEAVADNPYMLNAKMQQIKVKEGHYYTISMDFAWTNSINAPEKNVQINVTDANSNVLDTQKVTIPSGQTRHYASTQNSDGTFTVATYGTDTINITVAMGAFRYSYNQGVTTEKVSASGKLEMSNLKIVDEGAIPGYSVAPEPQPTTKVQPTTKDDYSKYSIWLNTGYAYMHVGQTKQVKVNKSGFTGGKVWFESDDTDIATVDSSGRIKA